MKIGARRLSTLFFVTVTLFLLILLPTQATLLATGVKQGLELIWSKLIPSLFPFLVLSGILTESGLGEWLGGLFSRPVGHLFGLSDKGATVYLMGLLCGFPVAAITAHTYRCQGKITTEECERLMLFANSPSIGFLFGTVGQMLFQSRAVGGLLFAITLLSSALLGAFLRLSRADVPRLHEREKRGRIAFSAATLISSVRKAMRSLFEIAGFVLLFSCIAQCLSALRPLIARPALFVLLSGILELTGGVNAAARLLSPIDAFRAAAFFSGFGGLCACMQVAAATEGALLGKLLSAHLVRGVIALLLGELCLWLFPSLWGAPPTPWHVSAQAPLLLFLLCIPLFCLLFLLLKKRACSR